MKVRSEFPRPTRVIDTAWIELSDGCRLAARVWLPVDAESDPVPAIVEYIPYRKNDATAAGDAEMHPYFAGFGYEFWLIAQQREYSGLDGGERWVKLKHHALFTVNFLNSVGVG